MNSLLKEPPVVGGWRNRPRLLAGEASRSKRRLGSAAVIALVFILGVVLAGLFANLIAPYGENDGDLTARLMPPGSPGHVFGTDGQGRDILSRLMYGARPTLVAGLSPVVIAGVLGIGLGVLAGLGPRWLNSVVMRTLDVLYAFPTVLLAIAISMALGTGLMSTVIALSAALTPAVVRMAETEVSRMRNAEYMDAARTSGAGWVSITVRQVVPVIAAPLIVYLTAAVGLSVVYAAGLSYLGLGVAPPQADWGVMVNELQSDLFSQPSLLIAPAGVIMLLSIAFNVLGDGLQRLRNVRDAGKQT